MSRNRVVGRIVIQHDWDEVVRIRGTKIWTSYKKHDVQTVRGKLKCAVGDGNTEMFLGEEGFDGKVLSKGFIQLSYKNEDVAVEVKVLAAGKVFSRIHKPNKIVNSLDVTRGGIGVSCDGDENVFVWMSENGDVLRRLVGHKGEVYRCRFLPSDQLVVTGSADMQLKIWDAKDARCKTTFIGHTRGITDFVILEQGESVVSISKDGKAKLWDCNKSALLSTIEFPECGILNACHVSPAWSEVGTSGSLGKVLYVACEMKKLVAMTFDAGQQIFSYDCKAPVNCCSSLSEFQIVCGTQDSEVHIVDVRNTSGPLLCMKECRSSILSLLPVDDGCYVTTGDGSAYHFDKEFRTNLDLTGPECGPLKGIVSDGRSLYTGGRDGIIRKYEKKVSL